MGFEESPSFDDIEKDRPAKKPVSQNGLRGVLLVTVLLLGVALLFFGGSQLGPRAGTEVGGLDGC